MIEALEYQVESVKSKSVRQQVVHLLVKVDKEMVNTIADNVGVKWPTGNHVPVSTSYPSLSQTSTPKYPLY